MEIEDRKKLVEDVEYCIQEFGKGGMKKLADRLGVARATVYRVRQRKWHELSSDILCIFKENIGRIRSWLETEKLAVGNDFQLLTNKPLRSFLEQTIDKLKIWETCALEVQEDYFYEDVLPNLVIAQLALQGGFTYFPLLALSLSNVPDDYLDTRQLDYILTYTKQGIVIVNSNWVIPFNEDQKQKTKIGLINNYAHFLIVRYREYFVEDSEHQSVQEAKQQIMLALNITFMLAPSRTALEIAEKTSDYKMGKQVLEMVESNYTDTARRRVDYSKFASFINKLSPHFFEGDWERMGAPVPIPLPSH